MPYCALGQVCHNDTRRGVSICATCDMSAILMSLPDKTTDQPHSGPRLIEPLTTKLYKYIYIYCLYIYR